jgi:hypothetical protein
MTEKRLIIAVIVVAVVFIAVFAFFLYAIVADGFFLRDSGSPGGGGIFGADIPPDVDIIRLTRPLGVFEHPEDGGEYIELVGPGYFELLGQRAGWAQILAGGEAKWVKLDFWLPTAALTEFLGNLPYAVSVYYYNIDTGFSFGFRCDVVYFSASLNKASHALYVYYLAERGLANLDRRHIYQSGDWRGGTGVMRHFARPGMVFSHWELMRHSVRDSDNLAFGILANAYARYSPNYRSFSRDLGRDLSLIGYYITHSVTAAEMGLLMRHIHDFFETDSIYSRHFQYSMFHSDVPIIVSDYPVAQKYGHWYGAFHDMAIVYACSPYILVILSDLDAEAPFHAFEEISTFIQEFNDRYFRTQ